MVMNSTNQIPPVPSGNLTSMQPDIYSTPAGVGGAAGPSMMNPQAQQTQVINFKSSLVFYQILCVGDLDWQY